MALTTAASEQREIYHLPKLRLTSTYSSYQSLIFQKFLFHYKIYSFTSSRAVTAQIRLMKRQKERKREDALAGWQDRGTHSSKTRALHGLTGELALALRKYHCPKCAYRWPVLLDCRVAQKITVSTQNERTVAFVRCPYPLSLTPLNVNKWLSRLIHTHMY